MSATTKNFRAFALIRLDVVGVCATVIKTLHFGLPELLVCCLAHQGSTGVFVLLLVSESYSAPRDLHRL